MRLRSVLSLVALSLVAVACDKKETQKPLVLGFLPSAQADSVLPNAQALGAFLSERIGRPVEVVVPSTYEPLVEGFRFNRIDIAFLDGGPAWIAHKRTGAEVILAELNKGEPFYWAEAFTKVGSGITSIDQLAGKRLAFTSRTGSSGFLMPIGTLVAEGKLPVEGEGLDALEQALQKTYKLTIDAGGYQQALKAVLEGRADVAFGGHDVPDRFLTPEERTQIVSFHRFGKIPSHSILVAAGMDSTTRAKVQEAFLALNEPANLPLLTAIYGVDGVVAATTEAHLGDFGRALTALPGYDQTLLNKKP
jgi:phosphonate transport system substrate-binding protein